jgi:hypothetical protein
VSTHRNIQEGRLISPGSDQYSGLSDLCDHRQTEGKQEDHRQQVRPMSNPSRPENISQDTTRKNQSKMRS